MKLKPLSNFVIPLGCKYVFEPEDHELIHYLSCKANEKPLPCEGLIDEIDLYSVVDPGRLFDKTEEKIIYVFTKVKKVSDNGKRVDRKVTGNRTWKGVDKGHRIYDKEGRFVGEKKNFNFMNKMKMKLGYNMTEFVLDKKSLNAAKFKDYVVCRIKRKIKKGRMGQEEDKCSSRTAIDKKPAGAIKEDLDSSKAVIFQENSLVTDSTIPFSQSAQQYCSERLLDCKKEPVEADTMISQVCKKEPAEADTMISQVCKKEPAEADTVISQDCKKEPLENNLAQWLSL